jgi:L-fuconolactonase
LDVVFENFGTNKIMFGSDWPVCKLAANYSQVVEVVASYIAQLSAAEQHQIWHENAKRFYNLEL